MRIPNGIDLNFLKLSFVNKSKKWEFQIKKKYFQRVECTSDQFDIESPHWMSQLLRRLFEWTSNRCKPTSIYSVNVQLMKICCRSSWNSNVSWFLYQHKHKHQKYLQCSLVGFQSKVYCQGRGTPFPWIQSYCCLICCYQKKPCFQQNCLSCYLDSHIVHSLGIKSFKLDTR